MRVTLGWVRSCLGAVLGVFYLGTQCLFAYQPEKSFWEERRKASASHPPALLASLPLGRAPLDSLVRPCLPAPSVNPSLSSSVAQTLPKGFIKDHARLLSVLSPSYGSIRKVSLPKPGTPSGPLVLHIQDVHMNQDAQRNIGETVRALMESGQVSLIALEGATEEINLQPFADTPHRRAVQMTADYLLRENKISGPIHAALTHAGPLPRILGIDDPVHYEANVQAYRASAPFIEKTKNEMRDLLAEIETQKKSAYSPELLAFDQKVHAYRSGMDSLGDYVRTLTTVSKHGQLNFTTGSFSPTVRNFLDALDMEQTLDFQKVESERARLIEWLTRALTPAETDALLAQSLAYRSGQLRYAEFYAQLKQTCQKSGVPLSEFPSVDAYVRYVLLADKIDAERLMEDLGSLENAVYARLVKTPEERNLVNRARRLWLNSKLVDFSLIPSEWKEYQTGIKSEGLHSFESFYEEAQARDTAMANNLLKAIEEAQTKPGTVTLLVTGGYHAEGMADRLTAQGATVISYVPKIEKIDTAQGAAYLSVFTQEKTPLEKLVQGEKLFLAVSPVSPAVRSTLLPALYVMALIGIAGPLSGIDPNAVYHAMGGVGVLAVVKVLADTISARLTIGNQATELEVAKNSDKIQEVTQSGKFQGLWGFISTPVAALIVFAVFGDVFFAETVVADGIVPAAPVFPINLGNLLERFLNFGGYLAFLFIGINKRRTTGVKWILLLSALVFVLGAAGYWSFDAVAAGVMGCAFIIPFLVISNDLESQSERLSKPNPGKGSKTLVNAGAVLVGLFLDPNYAEAVLRVSDVVNTNSIAWFLVVVFLTYLIGLVRVFQDFDNRKWNSVDNKSNVSRLRFVSSSKLIFLLFGVMFATNAFAQGLETYFDFTGVFLILLFVGPSVISKFLPKKKGSEAPFPNGETKQVSPPPTNSMDPLAKVDAKIRQAFGRFARSTGLDPRGARFFPIREKKEGAIVRYTMAISLGGQRFMAEGIDPSGGKGEVRVRIVSLPSKEEEIQRNGSVREIKKKGRLSPIELKVGLAFRDYAASNGLDFKKAHFHPVREIEENRYSVAISLEGKSYMADVDLKPRFQGFVNGPSDINVTISDPGVKKIVADARQIVPQEVGWGQFCRDFFERIKWELRNPPIAVLSPNNISVLLTGQGARLGFVLDAVFLLLAGAGGAWFLLLLPSFALLHVALEVQNNPKMSLGERILSFIFHVAFSLPYAVLDFSGGFFTFGAWMGTAIAVGIHGAYDEFTIGLQDGLFMAKLMAGTPSDRIDALLGRPGILTDAFDGKTVSKTPDLLKRVTNGNQGLFYRLGIRMGMFGVKDKNELVPVVEKPVANASDLSEMMLLAARMAQLNEAHPNQRRFLTVTPAGAITRDEITQALSQSNIPLGMVYVKNLTGPITFDSYQNEFENALSHFNVRCENMLLIMAGRPPISDLGQLSAPNSADHTLRQALLKALLGSLPAIAPQVILDTLKAVTVAEKSA